MSDTIYVLYNMDIMRPECFKILGVFKQLDDAVRNILLSTVFLVRNGKLYHVNKTSYINGKLITEYGREVTDEEYNQVALKIKTDMYYCQYDVSEYRIIQTKIIS